MKRSTIITALATGGGAVLGLGYYLFVGCHGS
jgi:hypothetical protein